MQSKINRDEKSRQHSHRNRIAIVDDDESVRRALDRLCRHSGFESTCFDSAEAYLAANRNEQGDCLILDLQLPGMNGLELCAQIRTDKRSIPIVMITGCDDEHARGQAIAAGVIAILRKPFRTDHLLDALNKALEL